MQRKLFSLLIAGVMATGVTGSVYASGNEPLPLMPKSEIPGTGNEPAGITGVGPEASSRSGMEQGRMSHAAGATAMDPPLNMPKSEFPGTGNEPAGVTGASDEARGDRRSTASRSAGSEAIEPLPLMPKSEYPGTGNEPAGITGVASSAQDKAGHESGQDTQHTNDRSSRSRSETGVTGGDFGEEAS